MSTQTAAPKASKDLIIGVVAPKELTDVEKFISDMPAMSASMVMMPRNYLEAAKASNIDTVEDVPNNLFKLAKDQNARILHPATYTVIMAFDADYQMRVFAYRRPRKVVNEGKLSDKYSIGVGGHVDKEDFFKAGSEADYRAIVNVAAGRELQEEVTFESNIKLAAVLNGVTQLLDLNDPIGCTHIGEVSILAIWVETFDKLPKVLMNSDGNEPYGFVEFDQVTVENGFENWSLMLMTKPEIRDQLITVAKEAIQQRIEIEDRGVLVSEGVRHVRRFMIDCPDDLNFNNQLFVLMTNGMGHAMTDGSVSGYGILVQNHKTGTGAASYAELRNPPVHSPRFNEALTGFEIRKLIGDGASVSIFIKEGTGNKINAEFREAVAMCTSGIANVTYVGVENSLEEAIKAAAESEHGPFFWTAGDEILPRKGMYAQMTFLKLEPAREM